MGHHPPGERDHLLRFKVLRRELFLCARCTGMLMGLVITAVSMGASPVEGNVPLMSSLTVVFGCAFFLNWSMPYLFKRQVSNASRFIAGILGGAGLLISVHVGSVPVKFFISVVVITMLLIKTVHLVGYFRDRSVDIGMSKMLDRALSVIFFVSGLILLFGALLRDHRTIDRIYELNVIALYFVLSYVFHVREGKSFGLRVVDLLTVMLSFSTPILLIAISKRSESVVINKYVGLLLMFLGINMMIVTLLFLRKGFSVLPSKNGLVDGGPYRFIRHPMYLGEMLSGVGTLLIHFNAYMTLALTVGVVLMVLRIRTEEGLLMSDSDYLSYMSRTRYRLIPYLY